MLFRLCAHDLDEELGRHRGRNSSLCEDEHEYVSHALWECSAYT